MKYIAEEENSHWEHKGFTIYIDENNIFIFNPHNVLLEMLEDTYLEEAKLFVDTYIKYLFIAHDSGDTETLPRWAEGREV